jgi:hypothetical protein
MSEFLSGKNIKITEGFSEKNVAYGPDLVIVGNAVSKDNPEVVGMHQMGLEFCSMPQAVNRFIASGKKPLVITGTGDPSVGDRQRAGLQRNSLGEKLDHRRIRVEQAAALGKARLDRGARSTGNPEDLRAYECSERILARCLVLRGGNPLAVHFANLLMGVRPAKRPAAPTTTKAPGLLPGLSFILD